MRILKTYENFNEPFKIGDYVTVVEMPKHMHWLLDYKNNRRTYRIIGGPMIVDNEVLWNVDGPSNKESGDWFRLEEFRFRHATESEIEDTYHFLDANKYNL